MLNDLDDNKTVEEWVQAPVIISPLVESIDT